MEVPKPVRQPKKKKRRKRTTRKIAEDSCDELWSKVVRTRDGICRYCGKHAARHAHHIFSRKYGPTRHVTQNGVGLCGGCHMLAHSKHQEFDAFIKTKLGSEYDQLFLLARSRRLKPDLGLTLIGLGTELDKLTGGYENGGVG